MFGLWLQDINGLQEQWTHTAPAAQARLLQSMGNANSAALLFCLKPEGQTHPPLLHPLCAS
jgi:hypothetical protein